MLSGLRPPADGWGLGTRLSRNPPSAALSSRVVPQYQDGGLLPPPIADAVVRREDWPVPSCWGLGRVGWTPAPRLGPGFQQGLERNQKDVKQNDCRRLRTRHTARKPNFSSTNLSQTGPTAAARPKSPALLITDSALLMVTLRLRRAGVPACILRTVRLDKRALTISNLPCPDSRSALAQRIPTRPDARHLKVPARLCCAFERSRGEK